jgi:hypothetical protein
VGVEEQEGGIRFKLLACRLSGSSITCNLLVTGSEDHVRMTLYAAYGSTSTRVIDTKGNEYHGEMASLGADQGPLAHATLPSGIPLTASVTFGGARTASDLKLLEIGFRTSDSIGGTSYVRFHNIPLFSGYTRERLSRSPDQDSGFSPPQDTQLQWLW